MSNKPEVTVGEFPKEHQVYIVLLSKKDTDGLMVKKIKQASKHKPYKFSDNVYFMSSQEPIERVCARLELDTGKGGVNKGIILNAQTTMIGSIDIKMIEWVNRVIEQKTMH